MNLIFKIKDESGNWSLEKCNTVHGGRSLIEATPETKSRKYNAALGKDRHNIGLWLKFLAVQVEIIVLYLFNFLFADILAPQQSSLHNIF